MDMWLPELEPALNGDGDVDRELLVDNDGATNLEGVVVRRKPVAILDPVLEEGDCGGVRTAQSTSSS